MNIFDKLGFKTGINAWGTMTKLGGSRLAPEVTQAMADAGKSFIPMFDFHRKAGDYIAELLGVEACCITCGAAAGLAISSAACISRGEQEKVLQLPDTTGMPDEIIMLKAHRILYDQALGLSGAKVREMGTETIASPELIEAEINDRTALFLYVVECEHLAGSVPLPDLIPIFKKRGVPVVVDAAAEIPPTENIRKHLEMGADLALFSGGKEIRGPQASGIIVGKKEFIDACHANCCPNYSIGRSMKISRETIAGLAAAVELFVKKDYDQQLSDWEDMSKYICTSLENRSDVQTRTDYPIGPGVQPTIILRAYIKPLNITATELQDKLLAAQTPVYVDVKDDEIVLNPQCLEPEELEPLIDILKTCLDDEK